MPFLTETGAAGFDAIYRHHCETLRLIEPSVLVPSDNKLSMRALVASTLNLLIGVPSRNFTYNVVSDKARHALYYLEKKVVTSYGKCEEMICSAM